MQVFQDIPIITLKIYLFKAQSNLIPENKQQKKKKLFFKLPYKFNSIQMTCITF